MTVPETGSQTHSAKLLFHALCDSGSFGVVLCDCSGTVLHRSGALAGWFPDEGERIEGAHPIASLLRLPMDEAKLEGLREVLPGLIFHSVGDHGRMHVVIIGAPALRGILILISPDAQNSEGATMAQAMLRERLLKAERVELQERYLQRAYEELDRYSMLLAHDLSAPIRQCATLLGLAEDDLKTVEVSQSARHYLSLARRVSARSQRQIEALAHLARIAGGPMKFVSCDMTAALTASMNLYAAGKQRLSIHVQSHDNFTVPIERDLLDLALQNIFENARKYSNALECIITVEVRRSSLGGEIAIHDNGPGISETDIGRVFELFFGGESSSEPSFGVGLALVKKICNRHGWEVKARNRATGGAEITINIPAWQILS